MAISEATEKWEASLADCKPQWDCLVALGDGLHCHALFNLANTNPLTSTISIGDRGTSKQAVSTDYSVAASSNFAGYAFSMGLYLVSCSPCHWRYRNCGIATDTIPKLDLKDFVPTAIQVQNVPPVKDCWSNVIV